MGHSNENEFERVMGQLTEKAQRPDFRRQFLDEKNRKALKNGLSADEIFEKAGFRVLDWREVSPVIRAMIQGGLTQKASGIGEKPLGNRLGQTIYGRPKAGDGTYYFIQKTPEGHLWSRIWMEGEGVAFKSLAGNPTP
jgi:hypothetical protein